MDSRVLLAAQYWNICQKRSLHFFIYLWSKRFVHKKKVKQDKARTYLHPHYSNGVFSNFFLSAGQH